MSILEKFSYPGMIRACCKQFPKVPAVPDPCVMRRSVETIDIAPGDEAPITLEDMTDGRGLGWRVSVTTPGASVALEPGITTIAFDTPWEAGVTGQDGSAIPDGTHTYAGFRPESIASSWPTTVTVQIEYFWTGHGCVPDPS